MNRKLPTLDIYIDDAAAAIAARSDADLNRALNLSRSAISTWRTSRSFPSDETMIALARLGGHDPHIAVLQCQQWRAAGSRKIELYKVIGDILATVTRTAAVLFLVALAGAAIGGTNHAQAAPAPRDDRILCDIRKWWRRRLSG